MVVLSATTCPCENTMVGLRHRENPTMTAARAHAFKLDTYRFISAS